MYYYNLQVGNLKGLYTYKSYEKIENGTMCLVNFANKKMLSIVIEEENKENIEGIIDKIKEIEEIYYDDVLSKNVMELIYWMKKYYISEYNLIIPTIKKMDYKSYKKLEKYKKEVLESENTKVAKSKDVILNEEQKNAVDTIMNSKEQYFLLYGITGSGKTEVYIQIMKENIKKGKETILLVPEIALTTQLMHRLEKEFPNEVVLYNSKITSKQKYISKLRVQENKAKIILGTRSALFLPTNNLGTIIIDEEHENSYKQDDNINYNAKTVAVKKAQLENSKLVLASATPSFESLNLVEKGHIKQINLTKRFNDSKLPKYEIKEIKDFKELLDEEIKDKIKEKLLKDEQIIILYNRKSYSILLECPNCGYIKMCPNCSNKLNYLKSKNILRCNHCNYTEQYSEVCPKCNSKMQKKGIGTEKIEEVLYENFGDEILRMDSDTMSTNKKLNEAYKEFKNKKKRILVGTQMIAKGFHFEDVTLVIILNLDQILSIPDFRNSEKTFQLVTQASGRAGRGKKEGEVLIQTFDKNFEMLKFLEKNDYIDFYKSQIRYREMFFLPPISKLIKISIINKSDEKALKDAEIIKKSIFQYIKKSKHKYDESLEIKDPEPAPIHRMNKLYKYIISIYSNQVDYNKIKNILRHIKENHIENKSTIYFDVEPLNLM